MNPYLCRYELVCDLFDLYDFKDFTDFIDFADFVDFPDLYEIASSLSKPVMKEVGLNFGLATFTGRDKVCDLFVADPTRLEWFPSLSLPI